MTKSLIRDCVLWGAAGALAVGIAARSGLGVFVGGAVGVIVGILYDWTGRLEQEAEEREKRLGLK